MLNANLRYRTFFHLIEEGHLMISICAVKNIYLTKDGEITQTPFFPYTACL